MNDPQLDTLQILLIIIVPSIIAGLPAMISAFGAWKDKRKRIAESLTDEGTAAEKVSNAWEKLVEDLQTRINKMDERLTASERDTDLRQKAWIESSKRMELKLKQQERKIRLLVKGVYQLIKQIEELGAVPIFTVPEDFLQDDDD